MSDDPSHPEAEPRPQPQPASPAATTPAAEDAGAQALSEALRSSFNIVKILMAILVVAFIASGMFTVKPNQVAVKLRFGALVGVGKDQLLQPGLHWKLPYPIDDVVYVPVGESHTITSTAGWYAMTPAEELAGGKRPEDAAASLQPGVDGYTLTGDGNIVHVKATVNYRIIDPLQYAFQFAQVTNLLEHVLDNALFYASAKFSADDALYRERARFQETVMTRVNESLEQLRLGITVDPREVRPDPPLYVQQAFNEVLQAQQRGDIRIREAESYARGATNKAVGEASAIVRDALTRSNSLVTLVSAEAESFLGLLPSYERNPELLRERLLAETTQRILTNAQFKAFLPQRADGQAREVRLLLNKEIEAPKTIEAPPSK